MGATSNVLSFIKKDKVRRTMRRFWLKYLLNSRLPRLLKKLKVNWMGDFLVGELFRVEFMIKICTIIMIFLDNFLGIITISIIILCAAQECDIKKRHNNLK